ncbi:MAG TPA: branched-chain amino acid ABC transporter permease [Kiritimatiellia bacterium]|nr:branched-chain amino acid ABC transporter permease [Kiritimatiellia bacterium]HMO99917.1 branched-chain amino acid ABC transporter permease [Kiritimatiellia bacterium]HMP96058.1 branched-chain amino acid ABC transporter permease [Kiritimatiellia bacterium]
MQILANGFVQGLVIALLAIGFNTVFLPTKVFFVAQAGLYALSPFLALQLLRWDVPWWLAFTLPVVISAGLAGLMETLNHRPLQRREASTGVHLIASLGLYIAIVQIVAMIWGNETQVLRRGIDQVFRPGDIILTRSQVIAAAVSAILMIAYIFWLRRTNLGLQFRALADNPIQLALFGYNTDRLRMCAFMVAGGITACASLVTAYDIGFDPHGGLHAVLLAIVAVIIGGRGTFVAPMLGGILLGLLRAQVVWHWSARWQEAATFALLAFFLLFRPHGILGRKMRLEAE